MSRKFKVKDVELQVVSPSAADNREANKVYNQAFNDALKSKAIVRARLDDILKEQGLWDDAKQAEYNTLQAKLLESERQLKKGGITLATAKEIALQMKRDRETLRELISDRTSLDNHTAEGQADNAKFNYLVYACTAYGDNPSKKYFASYDDYQKRSSELVAIMAAQHVANFVYGLEDDYESKLPENKFLKDYRFVDDSGRLVNKEGKYVDTEGRLIDKNGRYIDEEGNFIDKQGNRVDEEGEYIVEFTPFLDDDGKPVALASDESEEESEAVEEKPKKAKKTAKKAVEKASAE
jgi:hypothetical protein